MEDYIAVQLYCNEEFCKSHDHAFVAVFDGHRGKEAAKFTTREPLWGAPSGHFPVDEDSSLSSPMRKSLFHNLVTVKRGTSFQAAAIM